MEECDFMWFPGLGTMPGSMEIIWNWVSKLQGNPAQTPHEEIKKKVLSISRASQPLQGFPDDPSTERPSVWSPVTEGPQLYMMEIEEH